MTDVLERIRSLLDDAGVSYRQLHHEPTRTSEDSARVRGEPLEVGGKALLMKGDGTHCLFVISAALGVDSGAIRRHLKIKKLRFATEDELRELTDLVPGSVPPFGHPILPFPLFVDESIAGNDRIAFNAGSLTDSIIMPIDDYLNLAKPEVFAFSKARS